MRKFMLAALLSSASLVAGAANAQDYPGKTIHIVCPCAAGGGGDLVVRHYAKELEALSGGNVIVENKPGAGGALGVRAVTRARPDGYSLVMQGTSAVVGGAILAANPSYDPFKDLTPVS